MTVFRNEKVVILGSNYRTFSHLEIYRCTFSIGTGLHLSSHRTWLMLSMVVINPPVASMILWISAAKLTTWSGSILISSSIFWDWWENIFPLYCSCPSVTLHLSSQHIVIVAEPFRSSWSFRVSFGILHVLPFSSFEQRSRQKVHNLISNDCPAQIFLFYSWNPKD